MDEDKNDSLNNEKKFKIILCGLIVHFLLLLAVFDVYFASPLDQGMTPIKSTSKPPAKRLVLIAGDGLRAESVYEGNNEIRIPFLSQIKESGTWGVVHTRMPTESRPGYVAMLAGIYEDPRAIFKGWKDNPVNFDSVVNQSTNSWCWGSPGVVNLFNKNFLSKIHSYTYDLQLEDFGKDNTGILDTWVYNRVESFLKDTVQSCDTDCDVYFEEGNFFFLHLLGIDTAGHGYKPHSKEYSNNIRLVDEIIKNTTELFEATFEDDATAFVFTSDHGMTDWGSHGSGSLHETEVPIIAWGAGIKVNRQREDINQIDIAPLLSSLIGINIPVNSLGTLPLNYLDLSEQELAEVVLSNTLQLLQIFNVKRLRTENSAIAYVPFRGITTASIKSKLDHLRQLKNKGNFRDSLKECKNFMKFLIEGVNYYHNYYQYPVLISVSLGFLGWILFLTMSVFLHDKQNMKLYSGTSSKYNKVPVVIVILIALLLCYRQKLPLTYYLYFSFSLTTISVVLQDLKNYGVLNNMRLVEVKSNMVYIAFYLTGIELLMYGFFNRTALTILMLLVGFWIFWSKSLSQAANKKEKYIWTGCCFILAVFPSLPVMKTSFNVPVYLAGILGWIYLFKAMYLNKIEFHRRQDNSSNNKIFFVQFLCLIFAAMYVLLLENGFIPSNSPVKYISWLFLLVPVLVVPLTTTFIAVRLVATFFAFAPFYLLVSPNYEVLFSAFYVALLCCWLLIESKSFQFGNSSNIVYYAKFENCTGKDKIGADVFRRAFLFMVFIFLGFFGTGNIASLSTFDPMWVRAFLTVYSPFKMMGLILLKFAVPFIFTCCVFRAINSVGKENISNTFYIILIFSDLMVLQLLYLITNQGSWLDIGTSLSRFIVMEGFIIILLVLYAVAHWITTFSY